MVIGTSFGRLAEPSIFSLALPAWMAMGYPLELWRTQQMAKMAEGACQESIPFNWKNIRGIGAYLAHTTILWGGFFALKSISVPSLLALPLCLTAAFPFHTISVRMAFETSKLTSFELFDHVMTKHGGWGACMAGYPVFLARNAFWMLPLMYMTS